MFSRVITDHTWWLFEIFEDSH